MGKSSALVRRRISGYLASITQRNAVTTKGKAGINTLASQAVVMVIRDTTPNKNGVPSVCKTYTLEPGQFIQRNIFQDLGLADADLCVPLRIEVDSGGPVAAYGSVIDNQTHDPVLVVAQPAT